MATEQRLPKSLQNQLAQADQLQAALAGMPVAVAPPLPQQLPPPVAPQPPAQPPVQAPAPATPPVAPQPPAAPAPQTPSAPVQAPQFNEDPRVAQMMAQFERMQNMNAQLQQTNAQLLQKLAEANAPKAPPPPAPADPTQVNQREAEVFGADLVQMVQTKVHELATKVYADFNRAAAQLDARLKQVEAVVNNVDERVEQTREQTFMQALTSLVPDWAAINQNPAWVQWLRQIDPIFGTTRQKALDAASEATDAQRVAAIFNAYKSTLPQAPAPQQQLNQLAELQAPQSLAAAPAPVQKDAPYFSTAEVNSFYNDVVKGKYRGREAEAVAKEAAINEAAAAGRITR